MKFRSHNHDGSGTRRSGNGWHTDDWMAWQFYVETIGPLNLHPESGVFCIAVEPGRLRAVMEALEDLDPELIKRMTTATCWLAAKSSSARSKKPDRRALTLLGIGSQHARHVSMFLFY